MKKIDWISVCVICIFWQLLISIFMPSRTKNPLPVDLSPTFEKICSLKGPQSIDLPPAFEKTCNLIGFTFVPPTLDCQPNPNIVMLRKTAETQPGTIWNCGELGKIYVESEKIFMDAKLESVLEFHRNNGILEVINIKHVP